VSFPWNSEGEGCIQRLDDARYDSAGFKITTTNTIDKTLALHDADLNMLPVLCSRPQNLKKKKMKIRMDLSEQTLIQNHQHSQILGIWTF
jgi:hypothetical protein